MSLCVFLCAILPLAAADDLISLPLKLKMLHVSRPDEGHSDNGTGNVLVWRREV